MLHKYPLPAFDAHSMTRTLKTIVSMMMMTSITVVVMVTESQPGRLPYANPE